MARKRKDPMASLNNVNNLGDIFGDAMFEFPEDEEEKKSKKNKIKMEAIEPPSETLFDKLLSELGTGIDPTKTAVDHKWKPIPMSPQEHAFYSPAFETFFGGAAGGGKGGLNSDVIYTPMGTKTYGEIKVGDTICHPFNKNATVVGVYPLGVRDIYKVAFSDGASVRVTEDHLWAYRLSDGRTKKEEQEFMKEIDDPYAQWLYWYLRGKVTTTLKLKELVDKANSRVGVKEKPHHVLIPLTMPVTFTRPMNKGVVDCWIDPYILGLFLGDGSISRKEGISIAATDQEVIDAIYDYFGKESVRKGEVSYYPTGTAKEEIIRKLNYWKLLGRYSNDKFIPEAYKYSSIENRISLMQGLIDTDGYVDDRGHVSYTSVSKQLAEDVQWVARSLGCKANITEKQGAYKDENGESVICQLAYTVWIQGNIMSRFSRMKRKLDRMKAYNNGVSYPARRIISIEYDGQEEATCIKVDNPIPLYITKDFIVTHNTDLMAGLATSPLSPHKKAIVFRSTYAEHKDFINRVREIAPNSDYKGGNEQRFVNLPNGKTLEIGSVMNFAAAQKYRGRPHDLKMFDEVCKIPEEVYTFLIAWARTTDEKVPVRIIAAGNPPANADEEWVIRRWAAWLDPNHKNPAKPNELRWYATLDGIDTEITDEISPLGAKGENFKYTHKDGKEETISPRSRTFIPAKVTDNPFLMKTDYMQVLQNLEEPFRSQLLYGEFKPTANRDEWKVIPSDWLSLSNQKWIEANEKGLISASKMVNPVLGLDVAETGNDKTILLVISENSVIAIYEIEGRTNEEKCNKISLLTKSYRHATIGVDIIGAGFGIAELLHSQYGRKVFRIKGSRTSKAVTKDGYHFFNARSEMWWALREAINPSNENQLLIPPNPKLKEELLSPSFEIIPMAGKESIKVEGKEEMRKKLKRSPDMADALIYALKTKRSGHVPLRIF